MNTSEIAMLDFAKGDGLLPAVVQDARNGAVLMVGYMNSEALRETIARGRLVLYSRSKQRLWEKGETSGHFLKVEQIQQDCDHDALLVTTVPQGPVCHLGSKSCFAEAPGTTHPLAFICDLEEIIAHRITDGPQGSYTARLHAEGTKRVAQKVAEEGLEVALAATAETGNRLIAESADLLFHLLVLLKSQHLSFRHVVTELQQRHREGQSKS